MDTLLIILLFSSLIVITSVVLVLVLNDTSKTGNNQNSINCPRTSPDIKEPKLIAFKKYLVEKMKIAIQKTLSDAGQLDNAQVKWNPGNQYGIAIHLKNTPINSGPMNAWATFCGGWQSSISACENEVSEPKFYFGSGTKPITATLVASKLYKLWKNKVATEYSIPSDFINWYAGTPNYRGLRGGLDAVNYAELFNITSGFSDSQFTETVSRNSNTQSADSSKLSYTQTVQEWIFCCPTSGLIKDCSANTGLFCDNSCDKMCPIPLDTTTFGNKCKSPFCPDNLCDWAWYLPNGQKSQVDLNSIPWESGEWCNCPLIDPKGYSAIINNLSIYNVAMMRSGIPDSDSIWAIDTAGQLASRTSTIGPIQFVSEIIGFDWNPLWTSNGPITPAAKLSNNYLVKDTTGQPVAMYSSSAYTFLGSLLWLLTSTNGKKVDWTTIDLNALLPNELYCLINFAGTMGNSGEKYFRTDEYKNKYYSYELTVDNGGVAHSSLTPGTPITDKQTSLEKVETFTIPKIKRKELNTAKKIRRLRVSMGNEQHQILNNQNTKKAPVYDRMIRKTNAPNPTFNKISFVDWDASSGVMCGNGWGTCSGMAEIYMNIFSPTAINPIMPKEVQQDYVEKLIQYEGPNWQALYNNKIMAPYCLGGQAWSQGLTYNCGAMGPDWFYMLNENPGPYYQNPDWKNGKIGVIPCYGHLGSTYGYCSCHIYFPKGVQKAYPPLINDDYAYVSPEKANNWSFTFEFVEGLEFTMSCTQNSCTSESQGPIQHFIYEVVKDPFKW